MAAYSLFVSQTHASKPCREERKNAEYKPFNSPQPHIVGLLLPLELVILLLCVMPNLTSNILKKNKSAF
jgi:hypothetical protein